MNTAIQMKVVGLRVAAKSLNGSNNFVGSIFAIGAGALVIFGLVNDRNVLFIGGGVALAVQAWLVWSLISALVSKLELDAELASTDS
jgi:hypothetical protein